MATNNVAQVRISRSSGLGHMIKNSTHTRMVCLSFKVSFVVFLSLEILEYLTFVCRTLVQIPVVSGWMVCYGFTVNRPIAVSGLWTCFVGCIPTRQEPTPTGVPALELGRQTMAADWTTSSRTLDLLLVVCHVI